MAAAETYLILKYGSIAQAYRAWVQMSYKEEAVFTIEQRQVLMDFEYDNLVHNLRVK